MQNSLLIKNKLSKSNLICYQIEKEKQKTSLYKYNVVVGAGKHVMNDIENNLTLKTRTKENRYKLTYLYLIQVSQVGFIFKMA